MTISAGAEAFDLQLLTEFNKSNFKQIIKNALFKSLRGKSRIEGDGDLKHLWPYLESEANKNGVIGVINKGGKLLMVPVANVKTNADGNKEYNYFFKKNPYFQFTELTIKLPAPVVDPETGTITGEALQEETFYATGTERDQLFAILENDVDMMPDLLGIDDDLTKLEVILDAIFHDIVVSKKKIYFVFPQDPDTEDWKKANNLWNKGIMGYIAMPRSAKPDAKAGKAGIDPNNITLQVYQPDNKGRDLWADYRNFMREILWKYGIRFDVLENKPERAPVKEVESSNSYFDNIENERKQCRENFIWWVVRNWGGKYTLKYGNV